MRLARLPIPVPPAEHETLASYLTRLATLHGIAPRELWEPISTPRPGTSRRDIVADRLAAITGRPAGHLARALLELRDPAPDWATWRHQAQPRCPRCDARHPGGPVLRLLPHHRYVCTRHRYWIGPPDAGQPATKLDDRLEDIVHAQRLHLRLLHRFGSAATFDAVLTGLLICAHLWAEPARNIDDARQRWTRRTEILIPPGTELARFSASRLFAAVYPDAVTLAGLIAAPPWRRLASGDRDQQQYFLTEVGRRLGRPDYQPPAGGDAIAHWMTFDSHRPPSRPHTTFPDTREHGTIRAAKTSPQTLDREGRSSLWFTVNRRGGSILLHHRHIRSVLVRDWSPPMDGIQATIAASASTINIARDVAEWMRQPAPIGV